jgi:hypothetical protein
MKQLRGGTKVKNKELLHLFELEAHESDTNDSMKTQAKSVAEHEAKQQVSLAQWSDDWGLYCVEQIGRTYYFEVYGTYKYVTLPDHLL